VRGQASIYSGLDPSVNCRIKRGCEACVFFSCVCELWMQLKRLLERCTFFQESQQRVFRASAVYGCRVVLLVGPTMI
jgi:hypothetical protein